MSRDWPPKILHQAIKMYPELADGVQSLVFVDTKGNETPMYSDEEKEIARTYPNLGGFGVEFLLCCKEKGVFSSEIGRKLIQEVEDMFTIGYIEDKDFNDTATKWYNGELEPGYYMEANNEAFAEYIVQRIHKIEKGE